MLSTSDRPCTDLARVAFQPKRKAKLGLLLNRDNTMENSRNYVQSRFPHHKYSRRDNVEEVDCWGQQGGKGGKGGKAVGGEAERAERRERGNEGTREEQECQEKCHPLALLGAGSERSERSQTGSG